MSVNGVNGVNGASNQNAYDKMPGTEGGNNMGQDAFLKLLTAQLQYQDPMKPQENGEFLAQLAQFTSLEKLTSIETSMKEMAEAFKTIAGLDPTDIGTGETGAGQSDGTDAPNNS